MRACRWLAVVVILSSFVGCAGDEEVPSFIVVQDIALEKRTGISETTDNITDVWLFVNDDFRGIYQLPCTIPHLESGNQRLAIYAGIKKNGIAKSREQYVFYEPFTQTGELKANQFLEISPTVRYTSTVNFFIEEAFEDVNVRFQTDQSSNTTLERSSAIDEVKYGNTCGKIVLNELNGQTFYNGYTETLKLPKAGAPVWLELDYANNIEFEVGVTYNNRDNTNFYNSVIFLNPTSTSQIEWNKIYIDLTQIISGAPLADNFQIVITARLRDNSAGLILLDNINLISNRG